MDATKRNAPSEDTVVNRAPMSAQTAFIPELDPPFSVLAPRVQTAPFVLCSPHSGRIYPREFLAQSRLDPLTLRKSEDCFVDRLFEGAAALGVPLISARFPRAYLDVNREPFELDPELFAEPLPDYANSQSVRVIGGLGTIARIVADGEEIYASHISMEHALARIDHLYFPFHTALTQLIADTKAQFGYAVLIDCHSMPSTRMTNSSGPRPDFVIGDRFGAACDPKLTRTVKDALTASGYDVHLNRPYAGGYITEHYGRPHSGVHAVQIEINRALYLNETRFTPTRGFQRLQRDLTRIAGTLFSTLPAFFEQRAAAE